MKKFLTVLTVIIAMMFVNNVVFAGGSGGNGHKDKEQKQSQKQEQEQSQNQSQNQNVNTTTTVTSDSSSSSSSSVGDIQVNQTYKQVTGVPLINPSAPPEVQLYELSATAVEKGIDLTLLYNETCKPVNSKDFPLESREEKIKKIQMIFTPHQDYLKEEKSGEKTKAINEVKTELPKEKVKCLGILNIESVAKKNVPLSQIYGEAGNYILSNFTGFQRIYLVDTRNVIAANRGVNNSGFGVSFAPGQSWLFGQATGAIGGGLSYGSGNASNATRLGTTFIILGESSDGFEFELPKPKLVEIKAPEEKKIVEEKPTPQPQPISEPKEPEKKKEKSEKKNNRHYTIPDWE